MWNEDRTKERYGKRAKKRDRDKEYLGLCGWSVSQRAYQREHLHTGADGVCFHVCIRVFVSMSKRDHVWMTVRDGVCVCLKAGWATRCRVSLELKCWQCCLFRHETWFMCETQSVCPACDQQTKQQTKPEDQRNWLYSVFHPSYCLIVLSLPPTPPPFVSLSSSSARALILFTPASRNISSCAQPPARLSHSLPLCHF